MRGVFVAAITPYRPSGELDLVSAVRLMAWFEAGGVDGVVLAGTNGEGPSLSAPERRDLLAACQAARGRLKLFLGVNSTSLTEAIWIAEQSGKRGVDGLLVTPPACIREGADPVAWMEALLDASPIPLIGYHYPQRSGVDVGLAGWQRISHHPNFAGLKDSSGVPSNLAEWRTAMPGANLMIGDETLIRSARNAGWEGTISGCANVMPQWIARAWSEPLDTGFWALFEPVVRAWRAIPQPHGHKAYLHALGVIPTADVRLPLVTTRTDLPILRPLGLPNT